MCAVARFDISPLDTPKMQRVLTHWTTLPNASHQNNLPTRGSNFFPQHFRFLLHVQQHASRSHPDSDSAETVLTETERSSASPAVSLPTPDTRLAPSVVPSVNSFRTTITSFGASTPTRMLPFYLPQECRPLRCRRFRTTPRLTRKHQHRYPLSAKSTRTPFDRKIHLRCDRHRPSERMRL